jgi:hypothetical protein
VDATKPAELTWTWPWVWSRQPFNSVCAGELMTLLKRNTMRQTYKQANGSAECEEGGVNEVWSWPGEVGVVQ